MAYKKQIFAVSDATGAMCERVLRAALAQFQGNGVVIHRVSAVRTPEQVEEIIRWAADSDGLVAYTIVSAELRRAMMLAGLGTGVPTVDVLGPVLTRLSDFLDTTPLAQPGLYRDLDDEYFRRIEAVDFTVKHDDGCRPDTLREAEIVLVGVSRSSKTPVSLYLSLRGWKVANVPLVGGIDPPRELFEIDQRRIIGFTIDPGLLRMIRGERQRQIEAGGLGGYTDEREIRHEIAHARRLFQAHGWPVIDVTAKAIEETSGLVLKLIYERTDQRKTSPGLE